VYRKQLPRIYELRDLLPTPMPPGAYFRNLDASLAEIPQKLKQYRDIENDLAGLDDSAWSFLKTEVVPRLTAPDPVRGWQSVFDILNQAKAYNYLKREGCLNVELIRSSSVKGLQTPDLKADLGSTLVLCEVKTVNISKNEADRRYSGGVGSTTDRVEQGFFNKLTSDLAKAKGQMLAYDSGNVAKKIVYVIVNFDDNLHEYADRYQTQIDQYVAGNPVPGLEIVLDIKPPFYTAMS
jgi:hypothetical protein